MPGGKETAAWSRSSSRRSRACRRRPRRRPVVEAKPAAPQGAPARRATIQRWRRWLSATRLNKSGSEKETWHVEFDLAGSGLEYTVGDSFGLFPSNDPALVDAVIAALGAPPDLSDRRTNVARNACTTAFRCRRRRHCCSSCSPTSPAANGVRSRARSPMAKTQTATTRRHSTVPGGDRNNSPGIRPDPEAFIEALDPVAAAALFDLVVAQGQSGPRRTHRRYRALPDRGARPPRRLLDLSRRPASSRDRACGSMRRKAHNFALPADPNIPIINDRPGHGRGPFPAPFFRSARRSRRRPAIGCSSATSVPATIFSTRTNSRR